MSITFPTLRGEHQMEKKMENDSESVITTPRPLGIYIYTYTYSPRHPASGRSDPQLLLTPFPPRPPRHGGWPSPASPSRVKFQPRPSSRLWFFGAFGAPEVLEPPGGPWKPLEAPGGPLDGLEAPGKPPHAWSNIYRP